MRRAGLAFAVTFVLLGVLRPAGTHAAEITAAGRQLKADLDAMNVERLWLPKTQLKSWRTGEASDEPLSPGAHALQRIRRGFLFAARYPDARAAAATSVGQPPRDWLLHEGRTEGWRQMSAEEAQRLANRGVVVVASFKNDDEHFHGGHGHIAIIRPSTKSDAQVAKEGPQITQAGGHNYNSTPLNKGFAEQVIARHQVLFFAYKP